MEKRGKLDEIKIKARITKNKNPHYSGNKWREMKRDHLPG